MEIQHRSSHPGFITIFLALMALVSAGVSLLGLGGFLNNLLVLGIAFAMASMVASQYMGLKKEGHLVHWTLVFPLALFALLVALLLGDIAKLMSHF